MYKGSIKTEARKLRASGMGLKRIAAKLNIAKSTASLWLRDMPSKEAEARGRTGDLELGNRSHQHALTRLKQWQKEAEDAWSAYRKEPLFMLGLGLYWGEGAKTQKSLVLSNSDPALIRIWIRWCAKYMPGVKHKARVTAHDDVDGDRAKHYWKTVTRSLVAEHVTRIVTRKDRAPTRICLYGTVRVTPIGNPGEWFVKVMYWIKKVQADVV
jgi:hypothetical protein